MNYELWEELDCDRDRRGPKKRQIAGSWRMRGIASALVFSALVVHVVPSPAQEITVESFYQKGGPPLSRSWRGVDYVAASKALLPPQGDLPRFNDANGGTIIRRLTDSQNLQFYGDTSVPAKVRFDDFVAFNHGWAVILQAYASSHSSGAPSDPELAAAMAFTLQATAAEMDLLSEYWPQIPAYVATRGRLPTES